LAQAELQLAIKSLGNRGEGSIKSLGNPGGGVDKIAWKSRGGVDKIAWKSTVGGDKIAWKSRGGGLGSPGERVKKLIENPREGVLNYFQNTVRGSPISMIVKER
jgi:hypothetical protein